MPTKGKSIDVQHEATAEEVALLEQDVLFDNWDDDPAIVDVGGFDSELHDPVTDGVLIGFLTGKRFEVGPNKSTMYEFDTREGLRSVWGATVLDSKLEHVPSGSLVRVEYLGERHGSSGSLYFDYSVKFKLVPGREPAAELEEPPY